MEQRRLRGDLIEVDKILTGLDKVDKEKLFPLAEGTRTKRDTDFLFWVRDARGGVGQGKM